MNKTTKGAIAASAAALLLLGGWGTRATWSVDDEVEGTALNTGYIKLVGGCDGWELLNGDPFQPLNHLLVPGMELLQHCQFTLDLGGVATVSLATEAPSFSGTNALDLDDVLDLTTEFEHQGVDINGIATFDDNDVIEADIRVKLPSDLSGTVGQDLQGALQDITITATQVS